MSNNIEFDNPDDDDTVDLSPQWMQSEDIVLDELCAQYREIQTRQKFYESLAKECEKPLEVLEAKIQAKMGQHKKVRTSAGYTIEWKPFKRKGYTVAAAEGERWELRSSF